jgi:hypothetical protein
MTGSQMLELLSARSRDISDAVFPPALKIEMLNLAALEVLNKLPKHLWDPFLAEEEDVSSGDTVTAWSTSMRNGAQAIKYVYLTTAEKYATRISLDQVLRYQNADMEDYYSNPRYYIKAGKIYMVPDDDTATVTYLLNPSTITDSEAEITAPFFDKVFHKTIVEIALALMIGDKNLEYQCYEELKVKAQEFPASDTLRYKIRESYKDVPQVDNQWGNI